MSEQLEANDVVTVPGPDRPMIQTINPATGEPGRSYPKARSTTLAPPPLPRARRSTAWRRTAFTERSALMREAGAILRRRERRICRADDRGDGQDPRPRAAPRSKNVPSSATGSPTMPRAISRDEPVDIGGAEAFVTFNPLGVVLAVMPWNFPFWQVFRFAAPALMAGNGALLKHASNVPGCALAIEEVFHEAGFPRDLFRTLLLPSSEVKALIEDDHIAAVTFDRQRRGGESVATAAGGVLKKCVLELGGSDAYVVLEDADVAAAAKVCATARMVNGGQSCIAGKRFIVVRDGARGIRAGDGRGDARLRNGRPARRGDKARPDAERRTRATKSTPK